MQPAQASQIVPVGTGDADLVERARGRDEAAIRAIMQANNRRLYRIARGILRNDGEAEDVVQETYVRAFTHLESFRGDSSLATWLSTSYRPPSTREESPQPGRSGAIT